MNKLLEDIGEKKNMPHLAHTQLYKNSQAIVIIIIHRVMLATNENSTICGEFCTNRTKKAFFIFTSNSLKKKKKKTVSRVSI